MKKFSKKNLNDQYVTFSDIDMEDYKELDDDFGMRNIKVEKSQNKTDERITRLENIIKVLEERLSYMAKEINKLKRVVVKMDKVLGSRYQFLVDVKDQLLKVSTLDDLLKAYQSDVNSKQYKFLIRVKETRDPIIKLLKLSSKDVSEWLSAIKRAELSKFYWQPLFDIVVEAYATKKNLNWCRAKFKNQLLDFLKQKKEVEELRQENYQRKAKYSYMGNFLNQKRINAMSNKFKKNWQKNKWRGKKGF
jgi:hypothetical protein